MVGAVIFSELGVVVEVAGPWFARSAGVAVIAIYVTVSLGATMLVGAGTIVEQKEVALSPFRSRTERV